MNVQTGFLLGSAVTYAIVYFTIRWWRKNRMEAVEHALRRLCYEQMEIDAARGPSFRIVDSTFTVMGPWHDTAIDALLTWADTNSGA